MRKLANRLKVMAQMVIPGQVVVDVGTDHAYLPIYLVDQKICAQVIGVEINPGPLKSAKQQVEAAGFASCIEIRAGDGLLPVQPGEAQVAVVAGMGGKTICEILEAAPEVTAGLSRLILQPMGAIPRVREWLSRNAWKIVQEDLLLEDGMYYLIIVAEPHPVGDSSQIRLIDKESLEFEVGYDLINRRHPLLPKYLECQIAREQRVLDQLKRSTNPQIDGQREKHQQRINGFRGIINLLEE